MDNTVAAAIITGIVMVIVQLIIMHTTVNKNKLERELWQQKIEDELKIVNKRLEEHNNYASHLAEIAQSMRLIEQDNKYIKEGLFSKKDQ
jgi:uncharacterized membrane-anchored protein YhcB (DUF1043 family)